MPVSPDDKNMSWALIPVCGVAEYGIGPVNLILRSNLVSRDWLVFTGEIGKCWECLGVLKWGKFAVATMCQVKLDGINTMNADVSGLWSSHQHGIGISYKQSR